MVVVDDKKEKVRNNFGKKVAVEIPNRFLHSS